MTFTELAIALTARTFTFGRWGQDVFFARDPMDRQMPQGLRREGNALVGFIGSYQLVIDRSQHGLTRNATGKLRHPIG